MRTIRQGCCWLSNDIDCWVVHISDAQGYGYRFAATLKDATVFANKVNADRIRLKKGLA